jgi:RNA polymerase sigma-70 factor (ECF subfamily)
VVREFKRAWEAKDIGALITVLDPDVTVTADGGGLVPAALEPVEGVEQVAAYLLELAGQPAAADMTLLERTVNGQPGLVATSRDGAVLTVFAFDVADDRVANIWAVRNPDKLRPWTSS